MASSAGKRTGKRGKGVGACESSSREVVEPPVSSEAAPSQPGPSTSSGTPAAVEEPFEMNSRPIRPDPYETWPDPNSSPYINWDPIQLEQSGFPFRDRKWICLCCFKGFQQRFSQKALMEEHIRRDHAVLQDFWARGCFRDLRNCSKCGKKYTSVSNVVVHTLLKHKEEGPNIQRKLRSYYRYALRETGTTALGWDGHIDHRGREPPGMKKDA